MTKYNKFESYEKDNISEKELKEAKRKAGFLGSLGNKFLLIVRMVESALMKHEYKINSSNNLCSFPNRHSTRCNCRIRICR